MTFTSRQAWSGPGGPWQELPASLPPSMLAVLDCSSGTPAIPAANCMTSPVIRDGGRREHRGTGLQGDFPYLTTEVPLFAHLVRRANPLPNVIIDFVNGTK